jgi:hypothetical protein
MSKVTTCPACGQRIEEPAYPGDGVYTLNYPHRCDLDEIRYYPRRRHELERQLTQARALLADALDLAPRMSDDDPIAPALADWCWRARAALR